MNMGSQRAACVLWAVIVLVFISSCCSSPELTINNCKAEKFSFVNNKSKKVKRAWSIVANGHCGNAVSAYEVTSMTPANTKDKSKLRVMKERKLWEGLYESYGISNGVRRYEHVLPNGTVFKMMRREVGGQYFWLIGRGGHKFNPLFYSISDVNAVSPPTTGDTGAEGKGAVWTAYHPDDEVEAQSLDRINVKLHRYPKISPVKTKLKLNDYEYNEEEDGSSAVVVAADGTLVQPSTREKAESELLGTMLHPAVSIRFGRKLHKLYNSAKPVPGISLDGLMNSKLLRKALDFKNCPIDGDKETGEASKWIGPESIAYCCLDKFRLDFKHWRGSKWSRALQSIASNMRFIGFLEAMCGIRGLVPMKIAQEEIIWAGSTIIGVKPGGFLLVHNDFNLMENLHRRINVLLYLNEDWEEDWQGHLEMWDHNNTRVLQRIPPVFNRMSIFTVTDDAFHGHPEPLNAPEGEARYALQIVYYTKEPGPSPNSIPMRSRSEDDEDDEDGENGDISDDNGKREFARFHGAIFQPDCGGMVGLREFCEKEPQDSYKLACQCNFRDS